MTLNFFLKFTIWIYLQLIWIAWNEMHWKMNILTLILVTSAGRYISRRKRQFIIQFILTTIFLNKFPLKIAWNVSNCWINFQENLDNMLSKLNKATELFHKLQAILPSPPTPSSSPYLVTLQRAFTRSHLHYGHIIHDQSCNDCYKKWSPYNTTFALAVIDAIRKT